MESFAMLLDLQALTWKEEETSKERWLIPEGVQIRYEYLSISIFYLQVMGASTCIACTSDNKSTIESTHRLRH